MDTDENSLEESTRVIGRSLLSSVRRFEQQLHRPVDFLYSRLMSLTTSDDVLKVELFRFVDALPALKTPESIARHLDEYLLRPEIRCHLPPGGVPVLKVLTSLGLGHGLLAFAANTGATQMARQFIAGRNAHEATDAIERLRSENGGHRTFTLDLLGEAVISESEALAYQTKYLDLITDLAHISQRWSHNDQIETAPWGQLPKVNVSVKLSSLYARFDPMAADATVAAVRERLLPILRGAKQNGVFVNFDMEQNDFRSITYRIFREMLCEDEFRDWVDIGIVVQAYLKEALDDLTMLRDWAVQRGTPIWIRLVKGAYWDYETIVAAQRGHPVPVWEHKAETDASYERCEAFLLQNWRFLRPAIASHNARSVAHAQALAKEYGLPPRAVEYQVLFGMGDAIGRALSAQGERVRVYVPFGELLPGMAYLVRRLLENSSNDSFIRQAGGSAKADKLLEKPKLTVRKTRSLSNGTLGFHNEPEADFALTENRDAMQKALETVRGQLGMTGMEVPVVINGQVEAGSRVEERCDPSEKERVVSRVHYASTEQATRALSVAQKAFPSWRDASVTRRAHLLRKVAEEFQRRRFEIAAWQVYEVGKPWRDADADIAEAIDFCRFYADEMERLSVPRRRDVPGEWNEYHYDARGVAVIIAPWNFPLAILTGMATAALVAGNPIIIKPSEQSSRIGYFLYEALQAAGCPAGVASFLPGHGEEIGSLLVTDPRVAMIAFTGSRAVGLSILESAAPVRPGQREIKRVIAEMGGKNAIIVDEDADLDEAVLGTLASMTGFSGQKCSACSRVIVIGSAYEPFCHRLSEAVKSLKIGPAEDPATTLGPVVDESSRERVERYRQIGMAEGKLLAAAEVPTDLVSRGNYVPALVFVDCPPDGRLCQEEIFAPVLAVLRASDLTEALALADDSDYGLTGGFYSRSPAGIERVRKEFRVGNLYINRKITGALVDRQPFGGARMSGVGSKAGGPDYLLQFLIPRAITESVMRRGFAPTATPDHTGASKTE